jgi:hypothetical protein
MNQSRKIGTVEVKKFVDSGMSRCLFGDWPRRKLLKLTHTDYERSQSFWIPQEKHPKIIPVSASGAGQ